MRFSMKVLSSTWQWSVLLFVVVASDSRQERCSEPGNLPQLKMNLAQNALNRLHESFFQNEALLKWYNKSEDLPKGFIKRKTTSYLGETYCNDTRRIFCPSYLVIDYDHNRFPFILVDRKCSCKNCLRDSPNTCKRVFYRVRVLRRYACDPESWTYRYAEAWEKIAVACVCVKPTESK